MMYHEKEKFRETFHVRRVEKCCGSCRHFERDWEESGCAHPKQREFDSNAGEYEMYGAYGGTDVNEGFVCDLWEQKEVVDA